MPKGMPSELYPAPAIKYHRSNDSHTRGSSKSRGEKKSEGNLVVWIEKADELLPMDNAPSHNFSVTAYYAGEPQDVIEKRKTVQKRGRRSAGPCYKPGSYFEDVDFCELICIPYNSREQLLIIDIFDVDRLAKVPDELIGRAILPLADPAVQTKTDWPLVRGFEEFGWVTVGVGFPIAEDVKVPRPLPDLRDFPEPISPSRVMNKHVEGADMRVFDIPRKGVANSNTGPGEVDVRTRSCSKGSSQGSSPEREVWVPLNSLVAGSSLGLDPPKLDVAGIMAGKGHPLPNAWKPVSGPFDASRLLKPPVLDVRSIIEGKVTKPVTASGFFPQPIGPRASYFPPTPVPVASPHAFLTRVAPPVATWVHQVVYVAPPRYVR